MRDGRRQYVRSIRREHLLRGGRLLRGGLLIGLLLMSVGLSGDIAPSQDSVIRVLTPPDQLRIGRNPLTLVGVVSDPTIETVYAIRLGAPVVILGRRHDELPGVPVPVIDGRFTATVCCLAQGRNTIRLTARDAGGRWHEVEVEAVLDPALYHPPPIRIRLWPTKRRERMDEPVTFVQRLTNTTTQPVVGTYRVSLTVPTGETFILDERPLTLSPKQELILTSVERLSRYTTRTGYARIVGRVMSDDGETLDADEFYVSLYHQGEFPFVDISRSAGVNRLPQPGRGLRGGAAFGDYDNDGWLDLYVTDQGRSFLYRNNGDGTFTEVAERAGVMAAGALSRGVAWGDYDNDGFRDLFITTRQGTNILYHNNGDGTFTDVTAEAGVGGDPHDFSVSIAWGDYNSDGYLDLYVGNISPQSPPPEFVGAPGRPNYLYRNNGDGTFTEVGAEYGVDNRGRTLAALWTDYDNDGDVDLAVVNDFGAFTDYPNTLYRNDGPDGRGGWVFTEVGPLVGFDSRLWGMGIGAGDVDNDGDLDYLISNCGAAAFHRNNGDGTFAEAAHEWGLDVAVPTTGPFAGTTWMICTWGVNPWDFDLDGWVDYYLSAGWVGMMGNYPIALAQPNLLFRNNRNGTFTEVGRLYGVDYPGFTRGATFGDIDNDGDLDIYLANVSEEGVLLRNDLNTGHHWLNIRLRGTISNRDAFGAKILVTSGETTQMRELSGADMHLATNSLEQVFGLGEHERAERVEVRWPSGIVQVCENVPADRKIIIEENAECILQLSPTSPPSSSRR